MKIAILLPDLRAGGVERVRLTLARHFIERGHRVQFVLQRLEGELLSELPGGVEIVDLGAPRVRQVLPALFGYLDTERPAALLAGMWPLTGLASLVRQKRGPQFRLVVSEHTDLREAPSLKRWERTLLKYAGRRLYRGADATVAVSEGVAESLSAVAGIKRAAIQVINNPVRVPSVIDLIDPGDARLDWWLGAPHRLISIGSLKQPKAYHNLIAAVSAVRATMDARLIILGEGPLRVGLQQQIDDLGLSDAIRLHGYAADPFPILARASLFVLSSIREGFPNVLTEALACGVPVVATDCRSGPREILADGEFGTLVPVGDADSLSRAIKEALARPHDPERLRARALDFAPEKAAKAYLDLLFPPA